MVRLALCCSMDAVKCPTHRRISGHNLPGFCVSNVRKTEVILRDPGKQVGNWLNGLFAAARNVLCHWGKWAVAGAEIPRPVQQREAWVRGLRVIYEGGWVTPLSMVQTGRSRKCSSPPLLVQSASEASASHDMGEPPPPSSPSVSAAAVRGPRMKETAWSAPILAKNRSGRR
jgi:hypothetical protein